MHNFIINRETLMGIIITQVIYESIMVIVNHYPIMVITHF